MRFTKLKTKLSCFNSKFPMCAEGGCLCLEVLCVVLMCSSHWIQIFCIRCIVSCRQYSYQLDGCFYSGKGKYRKCAKLLQHCTKQIKPEARQVVLETDRIALALPAQQSCGTTWSWSVVFYADRLASEVTLGTFKTGRQYFLNWVSLKTDLRWESSACEIHLWVCFLPLFPI